MGMKIDQNLTGITIEGVTGDGATKTIAHGLGAIPVAVHFTPYAANVVPFLSSKDATNVIVQGAAGTFDVTILVKSATPN